jgi:hypothetical protein
MASHLAELLNEARHTYFVGRDEELRLFRSVLDAACLPFCGLYVYGPGGVGKTALLSEFARISQAAGVATAYLDGRNVEPAPESFLGALGVAMCLTPDESPLAALASPPGRYVLLVDTYEMLMPLDNWLRQVFLPEISRTVLIVLAGREAPSSAWRGDPGWQMLINSLALRNFSPDESRDYLTRRGVPPLEHTSILTFTYGHPLALSLVADAFASHPDWHFQPEEAPDLIVALLERLIERVPGAAHRNALEACALVRMTTEGLLAAILDTPDAHDLFEWLRGLSFIQRGHAGLFPHDLVREALVADLRWRNPDWHAELHRRARIYYTQRVKQTTGQAQQRIVLDYIFLHRDSPMVRPFFEWQSWGNTFSEAARPADTPALVNMVARHEDEESARLAQRWLAHEAARTVTFRDAGPGPAGFLMMIALHQVGAADAAADPAVQTALRHLEGHVRLAAGEKATLFRYWMARDDYQCVSPTQSLIFVNAVQHYLTTPGLAYTLFPCADPDFWAPMFAYADLMRVPGADFEVAGRLYGVFGHDWRAVPPAEWLELLAEREILAEAAPDSPAAVGEALLVLSQPDFAAAVRQALHDFARPDLQRSNPLLRSRLVVHRAGARSNVEERVTTLQTLLQQAVDALRSSPREVKYHRALYHTYIQPAPSQEQAAELLNLPFSTFRRHLAAGVKRLADVLWQMELS